MDNCDFTQTQAAQEADTYRGADYQGDGNSNDEAGAESQVTYATTETTSDKPDWYKP